MGKKKIYVTAENTVESNSTHLIKEICRLSGVSLKGTLEFIKEHSLVKDEVLNLVQGLGTGKILVTDYIDALLGNKVEVYNLLNLIKSDEIFKQK